MSFFKKLKDRMFKSSSKIEEGLDAIVEEGGEVEVEQIAVEDAAAIEAEAARVAAEEAEAETARIADEQRAVEQAKAEQEAAQKLAAANAEAERVAAQAANDKRLAEEAEAQRLADAAVERARVDAELAAQKAEADRIAADKAAQDAVDAAQAEAAQKAQEAAELAAKTAAEDAAEAERKREAEETRIASERAAAELALQEERDRVEAEAAEALAEEQEKQAAEEQRLEEENRVAVAARLEAEAAAEAARVALETTVSDAPVEQKTGLLGRLFGRKEQTTVVRRALDDAMLESIEDLLITADMGVDTALRVSANLAEGRMGKKLSTGELKALLSAEVARIMEPVAKPMPLYTKRPQVVLVVGVNGSGKTTTIGKLASQFKAAGKTVVIAAGDTFRAAAVEQLQVWGDRAGVPVLTAPEGSDPASLAFDAMTKAEADGADLLMIDTAGRLQNRQDLMEELAKIVRVIRKKDPSAPHNTLLVLDATTGQNALNQVEVFQKISDVSGLVMTKLDGTAKGGVLVALADKFGLPIHAIGVGEQIDDLAPFDPEEFANALTGHDG
jgi:fused signal recognition particle receptor